MSYPIEIFKSSDAIDATIRDVVILTKDDYFTNYHRLEAGKYCVMTGKYGGEVRVGDTLLTKTNVEGACKRALTEGSRVFLEPDIIRFNFPKSNLAIPTSTIKGHKTTVRKTPVRKVITRKTVRR